MPIIRFILHNRTRTMTQTDIICPIYTYIRTRFFLAVYFVQFVQYVKEYLLNALYYYSRCLYVLTDFDKYSTRPNVKIC